MNMAAGILMTTCFIKSVPYKSQCTRRAVSYKRETVNIQEYSLTIGKSSGLEGSYLIWDRCRSESTTSHVMCAERNTSEAFSYCCAYEFRPI